MYSNHSLGLEMCSVTLRGRRKTFAYLILAFKALIHLTTNSSLSHVIFLQALFYLHLFFGLWSSLCLNVPFLISVETLLILPG